jgi:hypothetical protein
MHNWQDPVSSVNIPETMLGFLVKDEEEIALTAHDDEAPLLFCGKVLRTMDGINEAGKSRVVPAGISVAGSRNDSNFNVFAEEVEETGNDGTVGCEGAAVFVEGYVSIEC